MRRHYRAQWRSRRKGGILLECAMALAVISLGIALTAEGLALLGMQRRNLEQHNAAILALDQVLERVAATPWDQLTKEEIEGWDWSDELPPRAELAVSVTEEAGPPAARQVTVALVYPSQDGVAETAPLVLWRYAPPGGAP
jgi:hypothetical protein